MMWVKHCHKAPMTGNSKHTNCTEGWFGRNLFVGTMVYNATYNAWFLLFIWLVVFRHPSEKYEFVNWDDDIPNISGKIKNGNQTTNQLSLGFLNIPFLLFYPHYWDKPLTYGTKNDCRMATKKCGSILQVSTRQIENLGLSARPSLSMAW